MKDKALDMTQTWKSKRRSGNIDKKEMKHIVFASDKPAEIMYLGHKHDPPNPD